MLDESKAKLFSYPKGVMGQEGRGGYDLQNLERVGIGRRVEGFRGKATQAQNDKAPLSTAQLTSKAPQTESSQIPKERAFAATL